MTAWKGINHARMTRSMSSLSGAKYKILATVRRLIPDGERRRISIWEIAEKAKVSPSTVSEAMLEFENIYIRRRYLGRGPGGGYETEVIPPSEFRSKITVDTELSISTPQNRSVSDLSDRSSDSVVPALQIEEKNRSLTDLSIFLLHDHMQQQQQQAVDTKSDITDQVEPPELPPEVLIELRRHEADRKIIFDVRQYNPHVTVEQIREAVVNAHNRATAGDSHNPIGLALHALRYGQKVTPPRQITTDAPESSAAPPAPTPLDEQRPGTRRSSHRPRQERRCLTPTSESVPITPDSDDDSLHAQAVRLLGPTAHPLDIQRCIQQLAAEEDAATHHVEHRKIPDPGDEWVAVVTALGGVLPAEDIQRLLQARLLRSGPIVVIGVASDFERHVIHHRCIAALRRLLSERLGYPVQISLQVT